jgi:PAS domain S-box-containing protein
MFMLTTETKARPPAAARPANSLADGFQLASAGLTALAALTAVAVLLGWVLGRPELKSVFPGAAFMRPGPAIAILLTSVAILIAQRLQWSPRRDVALRVLAGTSALIVAATVIEILTGANLQIDQLGFSDPGAGSRLALSAAAALLFLDLAVVVADTPGRLSVSQILTGGAIFLSLISSIGYFFGVDVFTGIASYTAMALHTSGCLLLMSVGLFFARPTEGVMAVVSDPGPSGFVVRRLLPPVFVVPVALAWLSWQGERAGFYSAPFAMTFFAVSAITALSAIVYAGGSLLRGLEARREAAERLRVQSEERLRLAVTDAPVPMAIHDDADHILHMSRGWCEQSGYTRDETPTITAWTEKAQGMTTSAVRAYVEKLGSATGTVYGGESSVKTKTGDERVWDFSTTPLSGGGDGRIYLTMAVDVTERKRAEAELRQMNEELEQRIAERTQAITEANDALRRQSEQLKEQAALLDLVREGIIVRDLYGTIVYWSVGASELYGWTRDEALGQVSHKLLKASYGKPLPVIEKQVTATGFWEGEVLHTTKDGQRRAVESRWTLTRNERGVPQGFLEVNRDITARKRADALLRDSETRFRAVSETANEGILSADSGGMIRYWNPGAERMFRRPEDQAIGQPLTALLPERYHAELERELKRYRGATDAVVAGKTVELTGVRMDGSEFPIEVSISSFQTSKGMFFSWILRDITNRKQAERALQSKAEELARSNQELEQFAYVASHDLQEPLRMVANYTKLLGTRYRDKLDGDAREFIDFAVDGAIRMQHLIRDLLEFARVGTRGKEFKPTAMDAVVQAAVSNLSGAIDERHAQVIVEPMPTVPCDGAQLTQVFQNLMGNAIKFCRPDTVPIVKVFASHEDGAWRFAVQDNGIGIEPKYFDRIFQMFQRLHGRGEYEGTGIGLALCKKIVERHGGRVTVASEKGKGTTFSFTIPDAADAVKGAA